MSQTTSADQPLIVVPVHGTFADSSSWNGVIDFNALEPRLGRLSR